MNIEAIPWPPEFTLIKNRRARRVHIKISPQKGLELVVPYGVAQEELHEILNNKRPWIEKHLHALKQRGPQPQLPDEIRLPAIEKTWRVEYQTTITKFTLIERPHNELVLLGDKSKPAHLKKILAAWLKAQGEQHLIPWLYQISKEINLPFKKVSIRGQSSRWGSCTLHKVINLNYKLLFLPTHLVRHILIHELCHTIHLDHSQNFWKLVECFDSNWYSHRKETRKTQHFIPPWIE